MKNATDIRRYLTKDTCVEAISGEITLYDLIAWEPRIQPVAPRPGRPNWRSLTSLEVDWVVMARPGQPMVPTLRGGELIILPERLARDTGVPFGSLVRELGSQPVAGVLTDYAGEIDPDSPVTVLHIPSIHPDLERDLNRIITNGRRQALQRVAELDQAIAEANAGGARPGELIDHITRLLGMPVTIHTPGNAVLFTTGTSRDQPTANSDAWVRNVMRNGATVWLGSIPPAKHALARFAVGHVRDALQRALDSSTSVLPRGSARSAALNALLLQPETADRERLAQQAHLAGVPTDRTLRVAYSSTDLPETHVRRALQYVGDVMEAGVGHNAHVWLVAGRAAVPANVRLGSPPEGWLALSAPVPTPGHLPQGSRQARYLGILLEGRLLNRRAAAFDDPTALGVHGLLYPGWETPEQREYRDLHLGELIANDPRGQLVETLGVYLDQQGSQSHAADALGIHRNTLSYRLRQIESALAIDLIDPHNRLTLHIAIAIHRLIRL